MTEKEHKNETPGKNGSLIAELVIDGGICNNNCGLCCSTGRTYGESSPLAVIKHQIHNLKGNDHLLIRGREPALRNDFFEIVSFARKEGFSKITLESNGRIFSYKNFGRKCLTEGISCFNIYLLGSSAEIADNVTQTPNSFNQGLWGLKTLVNLGAQILPTLIITHESLENYHQWISLLSDIGIKRIAILFVDFRVCPPTNIDQFTSSSTLLGIDFFNKSGARLNEFVGELKKGGFILERNGYQKSLDIPALFEDIDVRGPHNYPKIVTKKKNRLLSEKELEKNSPLVRTYPEKIIVELTYNCNFKCIMCPRPTIKKYRPELDMPFPLFQKIADLLFPTADYVDLRGFGESTIMRNFERYLDYALRFPCKFGILTNLSLKNDLIWEKMIKHGFFIGISLDGATKETVESIRVGANFEAILVNMRKLVAFRKRYNQPEDNLKLTAVIQTRNYTEMPAIIDLAYSVGITRVQFSPSWQHLQESPAPRDFAIRNISPEKMGAALNESLHLAKKYGIKLEMTGSLNAGAVEKRAGFYKKEICDHPWTLVYITYDGRIGPCNHLIADGGVLLGDLSKDNFYNAWNSLGFQLFRKLIHTPNRFVRCEWCFRHRYGD